MQMLTREGRNRILGGAALAAAAAATVAIALPAMATAAPVNEVLPPTIVNSLDGSVLNLTVTNPNPGTLDPTCGAYVLDAAKLPGVLADPTSILEPGVVAWGTLSPLDLVFPNATGDATKSYATPELPDGAYAVIGECTSALDLTNPQTSTPQIVLVGGPLAGLGSLFGS